MEYKVFPFEIKEIDEQGIFKGYASTFGGQPDLGGDIIEKGAFQNTLIRKGKFGTSIKMLWQHSSHLLPVGTWKLIEEDNRGLKVEGQYALKTQMGSELYELSKMDPPAIDSLSIGYETIQATYPTAKEKFRRKLQEVELYEISPVNFPMNPKATITAVKAVVEESHSERELEEGLKKIGLSVEASKYIVKYMKVGLAEKWNSNPGEDLLKSVRDAYTNLVMTGLNLSISNTNRAINNL